MLLTLLIPVWLSICDPEGPEGDPSKLVLVFGLWADVDPSMKCDANTHIGWKIEAVFLSREAPRAYKALGDAWLLDSNIASMQEATCDSELLPFNEIVGS